MEAERLSHDLGELTGPILVFGGPLSNFNALETLFGVARARNIPPSRMICTGDVAGYCADPEPCLAALRAHGIATVMGNVEEALGADAEDCGCNFVEGSTCDALSGTWYSYARTRVSEASRAWMAALPRSLTFRLDGHGCTVIHGGLRRINRYVFASDTNAIAEEFSMRGRADVVVAGHAGLPFTVRVGNGVWHNAGALGMPANEGTPRVWYSVVTAEGGGLRFAHEPLAYDHGVAARKMREAHLPEPYARALETGLWPDTAILPPTEARATGTALAPSSVVWLPT